MEHNKNFNGLEKEHVDLAQKFKVMEAAHGSLLAENRQLTQEK
jgi:hypothetical protein